MSTLRTSVFWPVGSVLFVKARDIPKHMRFDLENISNAITALEIAQKINDIIQTKKAIK